MCSARRAVAKATGGRSAPQTATDRIYVYTIATFLPLTATGETNRHT